MKIVINAELGFSGRSGVEARSPDLRLTSHGLNEQDALQSLKRGITAWCAGLQSMGKLEEVLKAKNIHWEDNGGALDIELTSTIHS